MNDFRVRAINLTSSQLIKGGHGRFYGFYVNSTSSGTAKFWDSLTAAGTIILNTVTPAAGNNQFNNGVEFDNGLYITVGATLDITVFFA